MERYNLKTIANESMVIEEYKVFVEEKGYFSLSSYTQARYGGAYNIMYRAIDSYNPATGRFGLENSLLRLLLFGNFEKQVLEYV